MHIYFYEFVHKNISIDFGSKKIKTQKGVPQGMLTSPYLFNVYIREFAVKLWEKGIKIYLYADDIIAICRGR